MNFIAGDLDEKYAFIGKECRSRLAIQYNEIKNSGHALLVAPLKVASVIVKSLSSQQDMPSIDVLKLVPFENRPKVETFFYILYSVWANSSYAISHRY